MSFFQNLIYLWTILFVVFSFQLHASDHIDGPATSAHAISDLTDLYAFPTPHKKGYLTLILNVHPLALDTSHFSDKVFYRIVLSESQIKPQTGFQLVGKRHEINCQFITPHVHEAHEIICHTKNGLKSHRFLNSLKPTAGHENDFIFFAGHRSDPFFFNADWAKSAAEKGKLLDPKNDNIMDKLNILSLVIEFNVEELFEAPLDSSLLAIAAESFTHEIQGDRKIEKRLDRLGRPEMTNVSLVAKNNKDLRDLYNKEDIFTLSEESFKIYQTRLSNNIHYYDQLDGEINWNTDQRLLFSNILTHDFLLIDLNKPCLNQNSFLDIEKAFLAGIEHQSCGGRKLADDIMDTLFSTYILGLNSHKRIEDGVAHPYRSPLTEFPYLAVPDFSFTARLKANLAKIFL